MRFTNNTNMSLLTAVWAIADDYEGHNKGKYISATSLLQGTKINILSKRVDMNTLEMDIADLLPSAYGTAIHAAIEKAWNSPKLEKYLQTLGLDQDVISRVRVNPEKPGTKRDIDIYLEQRAYKEINGWTVNGQFDAVVQGRLYDNKSMAVYGYQKKNKIDDFILQGSIYRWLNPELIKEPNIGINYIFTDWSKVNTYKPDYPKARVLTEYYQLKTLKQTEEFIANKLAELDKYMDCSEEELPRCTDKDLWRSPSQWKVYKDANSPRALPGGVFDAPEPAYAFASVRNGIVKEIKSEAKRCQYCKAATICKQAQEYYPELRVKQL